jgi:hypothetical protein
VKEYIMNLAMFVVAVFILNGEIKTVRLETPNVQQCVTDALAVESTLTALGAEVSTTFCMIEVTR